VIKSFKHKGLQRFYETGNATGVRTEHKKRLRMQLTALDTAQIIEDMDISGFRLHPLKGDRRGLWAIDISHNWRLVFRFEKGHAYNVHYEDYH